MWRDAWNLHKFDYNWCKKGTGKVFYGQEPPSGESTRTECWINYQLLAVITEVAQWGTPSCSGPKPARTMASETVDSIDWSHPPPSLAVPPERLVHSVNRCSSATAGIRSCNLQHARQPPCGTRGIYNK